MLSMSSIFLGAGELVPERFFRFFEFEWDLVSTDS